MVLKDRDGRRGRGRAVWIVVGSALLVGFGVTASLARVEPEAPAGTAATGGADREPWFKPRPGCPRCGTRLPKLGEIAGEWHIGAYTVLHVKDRDYQSRLVVQRKGRVVYKTPADSSAMHMDVGSSFGGVDCNRKVLAAEHKGGLRDGDCHQIWRARRWLEPGADATGNGKPNLVVFTNTGGASCCMGIEIFELGSKVRYVTSVGLGRTEVKDTAFVDLDGDGWPEIETFENGFNYWITSGAASPAPRVVLELHRGDYRVSAKLMKRPAPGMATLGKEAAKLRKLQYHWSKDSIPADLFLRVLDLVYQGHSALARRLLEQSWPPGAAGMRGFISKLRAKLKDCDYWSQVRRFAGPF